MKCPYNNFEECLESECPAYYEYTYSYKNPEKTCRYITNKLVPPTTTIINNYYNKEEQKNN